MKMQTVSGLFSNLMSGTFVFGTKALIHRSICKIGIKSQKVDVIYIKVTKFANGGIVGLYEKVRKRWI